jgi:hypothetical protein
METSRTKIIYFVLVPTVKTKLPSRTLK